MTNFKDWVIATIGTTFLHLVTAVLFVLMIPAIIGAYALEGVNIVKDKLKQ